MPRIDSSPAARERQRIRRHLSGAERLLAAGKPRLSVLQVLNRRLLLEELRRYRRSGRFPVNLDCPERSVPHFIDAKGTPCAVAHLLNISGQGELVRHIARTDNTARVQRLARLSELRAWLAAAGLSLDEAARIQPTYCFVSEAQACFCRQGSLGSLGLGTVVSSELGVGEVIVERLEGQFSGVALGERVTVTDAGQVNDRILFYQEPAGGELVRVGQNLVIEGDVRCQLNQRTATRPVSVDTAFQALLADESSCVEVLRTDQSAWNESQCTGADQGRESGGDGGCGLVREPDATGAACLTSVAVLAALVAHRRRRRG